MEEYRAIVYQIIHDCQTLNDLVALGRRFPSLQHDQCFQEREQYLQLEEIYDWLFDEESKAAHQEVRNVKQEPEEVVTQKRQHKDPCTQFQTSAKKLAMGNTQPENLPVDADTAGTWQYSPCPIDDIFPDIFTF